jgi:hypothetical protein
MRPQGPIILTLPCLGLAGCNSSLSPIRTFLAARGLQFFTLKGPSMERVEPLARATPSRR